MLNTLARVVLFFSSYVPLAAIFFILYVGKSLLVTCIAAAAFAIGIGGLFWITHRARVDVEPVSGKVVDFRRQGDAVMGYVATYLIPFVGFSLMDLRQGIALAVFLVLLAYLYVTTDMIHINPTLHVLRYHVYEVTFEPRQVKHLISRRAPIECGDVLQLVNLSDDLLVERKTK